MDSGDSSLLGSLHEQMFGNRNAGKGISRRRAMLQLAVLACGTTAKGALFQADGLLAIPASRGYLLVDSKKCQGCLNCMVACSMVHHGEASLSLSRIQVAHDHLGNFPDDVIIAQCRQCVEPACLRACPSGALTADSSQWNVRKINAEECIGCWACVEACPFPLARSIRNHEANRAEKCDLCADTPFWTERSGPRDNLACLEICPVHAIAYTEEIPAQEGDAGYLVNLRGKAWKQTGFSTD
jgi:protein NrfC